MKPLFILGGVILALFGALAVGCTGQLDQGEEGVKTSMGVVTSSSMSPGPYLNWPFQTVYEYDNRSQTLTGDAEAYTQDVQVANINYSLKFVLNRGHAGDIYKSVKSDWQSKLVTDFVNDSLKTVIGKMDAVELVQNRDKASPLVEQMLQARVDSNLAALGMPAGTITVSAFTVNNVKFNQEFEDSVERKVVAIQNAEAEHNKTAQTQEQANQTVIAAKADAEAMQIKSQALSQNQNLVSYEAVQKWNGVLPVNIYGGAPIPFINIDTK